MDDQPASRRFWDRLAKVPADELWESHQRQKLELAIFARGRLRSQFARHGEAPSTLEELEAVLDPSILTIGFARRFATYKRSALLFTELDRLARLLWDEERPMQVIFAGKAHPADRPGQGVIQDIFGRSRSPKLRGRVFILEDYDIRDRAVPGPGRGRVAQQPAPAARGVGDVRHEGGRRTASSTSACSTAGGTRAGPATTAGPSAVARPAPTRAPRTGPTPRTCTGSSRTS